MVLSIIIKAVVQTVNAKTAIDEIILIAFLFFLANKYRNAMNCVNTKLFKRFYNNTFALGMRESYIQKIKNYNWQ
jgi:hypothetical protein